MIRKSHEGLYLLAKVKVFDGAVARFSEPLTRLYR